jgi:ADP-ribose pyrophosphatase YjhB (NUDIX family)
VLTAAELRACGVFVDDAMPVSALADDARALLAASLDLPVDRQVPFREMQARYGRRRPFTKAPALFAAQLEAIALKAAAEGCRLLELSLFDILDDGRLDVAQDLLPRLEARHGVSLRFLMALHREDDLAWDLDMIARFRACADARALVGFDFMGHERTSTRAFTAHLEACAAVARDVPGLVVRVHAGENPAHPENVAVAVDTLLPFVEACGLELRIGHGLYGVADDVLARMARWSSRRAGFPDGERAGRVVVEFNLTSNLALNNIQTPFDVPIARTIAAGVDVVLATDGAGLYRTCLADEAAAARACGVDDAALATIAATENRLRARRAREEATKPAWSAFRTPTPLPPHVHYTPAFRAQQQRASDDARRRLFACLDALGLPLVVLPQPEAERDALPELVLSFLAGRDALVVSGAWKNAWAQLPATDVARARAFIHDLVAALGEAGDVVLITGGTSHGVEGVVHEAVAARRASGLPAPPVLGVGVTDLPPDDVDGRLSALWLCTDTLYDKQGPLMQLARHVGATALVIGGGAIVLDEIQAAHNHRLRTLCVSDVDGAAARVAALQPRTALTLGDDAVGRAAAVARVLTTLRTPAGPGRLRRPGANDAVDIVAVRRGPGGRDEVLLIARHSDAGAEAGRFALPGGFVEPGESCPAAACREVREETGLVVDAAALTAVTVVEGGGRDPRDTADRWVRSHVFATRLPDGSRPLVRGGSDAARAFFVDVERLPGRLAFDHDTLLQQALQRLR